MALGGSGQLVPWQAKCTIGLAGRCLKDGCLGRRTVRGDGGLGGRVGFAQHYCVGQTAAQDLGLGADLLQVGLAGGGGHRHDQSLFGNVLARGLLAGVAQGADGGGVGGDDPVHDGAAARVVGSVGVIAGGVQGQEPQQSARCPPHPGPVGPLRGLIVVAQFRKDGTGGGIPQPLQGLDHVGLRLAPLGPVRVQAGGGVQCLLEAGDATPQAMCSTGEKVMPTPEARRPIARPPRR